MSKKLKDTDYLSISTRVRAMENRLLTRERMERMIDARTDEEAVKVLSECGYGELPRLTSIGLDDMLARARDGYCQDLRSAVPDKYLIDVFQMKYDYHNLKTLIKAEAMGVDAGLVSLQRRALSCEPPDRGLPAGGVAGVQRSVPRRSPQGQGDPGLHRRPAAGRLPAG